MDENISRGYIQLGSQCKDRLLLKRTGFSSHPPSDSCHCIYLALLLAGVGFLLPYNSFIIAVDYFQSKYPATTIVFDMSLIYILVAFVAVIINNVLVETLSLNVRIVFGYIIAFFTLTFVAIFEICFEIFDDSLGYSINLIAVAVVAFGCTVQQSSFYGYTSMLPSRYTQAVMTGESAAGLLVSTNRILTKLLLENEKLNTILFFCISIGLIVVCFVIHFILQRTEFVNFYLSLCVNASESDDMQKHIILEPTEDVSLVDILDPAETKCGKYGVLSLRSPPSSPVIQQQQLPSDAAATSDDASCESLPTKYRVHVHMRGGRSYAKHIQWWTGVKRGVLNRVEVSRLVWPYMVSIALAYFVTLCLFPGIESEIVSCNLRSWMPVILMAIFNLFDFVGKIFASASFEWKRRHLVLLSAMRILLVPLLAACVAPRGDPLLPGEGWSMFFSAVLGITNGIAGSVPMIVAPSMVSDDQKELTGNIMTLSYSIGLTLGSGVAYFIDYLLGPTLLSPCAPLIPENITEHSFSNLTIYNSDVWNITLPLNYSLNNSSFL